jgi:ribosomal protein S18 acetylase RimI-like enzyme
MEKRKKPLPVDIREMTLDDLPAVYAMGERLFRAGDAPNLYRSWTEYVVVENYASDKEFCLVAEYEDKMVGFAMGYTYTKRRNTWTYGYLEWLGVDPDMGGHGIGRALVKELTALFRDEGVRMMIVDTEAENHRAINLFQKLGFNHPVEHVYMTRVLKPKRAPKPAVRNLPTKGENS